MISLSASSLSIGALEWATLVFALLARARHSKKQKVKAK